MSVGDRIQQLRKDENLSQAELAKLVGVSRQAVSKWENGQSLPDSLKMIHLAEVLKTDVEYLTTGRIHDAIRPPIVIKTVETVEKTVEVPFVQVVEKPVEKIVEVPVVQYIEKPVTKRVVRVVKQRDPVSYLITGAICLVIGFFIGILF